MKTIAILAVLGGGALLTACATTRSTSAEEHAYCVRMAQQMGTSSTHDHSAMKGMPANSMNVSHKRCQEILNAK